VITDVIMIPIGGVQLGIRLVNKLSELQVLMNSGHAQVRARLPDSKALGYMVSEVYDNVKMYLCRYFPEREWAIIVGACKAITVCMLS
jgi:hypothetical protein